METRDGHAVQSAHAASPSPFAPLHHHVSANKFGPATDLVYHESSGEQEKVTRLRHLIRPPVVRQWVEEVGRDDLIRRYRSSQAWCRGNYTENSRREKCRDSSCSLICCTLRSSTNLASNIRVTYLPDAKAAFIVADAATGEFHRAVAPRSSLTGGDQMSQEEMLWLGSSSLSIRGELLHGLQERRGVMKARTTSWSIWEEARKYSNQSGTDDLVHRVWVLIGMACLLGYSANASAIELHPSEDELSLDSTAVRAATAFYLVIKLTRVIVLWLYAYKLPRFRQSHTLMGLAVLIPMLVYLPLIWVTSRRAQIIIASIAVVVDLLRIDHVFYKLATHWKYHRQLRDWKRRGEEFEGSKPNKPGWFSIGHIGVTTPAMNIEHVIERNAAFVVIVLGELVINLIYVASASDFGVSRKYGKAVMGLMVAWAINWLYSLPMDENHE
ncbi:hypothetical protein P7C73_g1188, partial [Tremellales sp. Uapishka_1]